MSEYADWVDDAREPDPWHDCEVCGAVKTAERRDADTDQWVCGDCAKPALTVAGINYHSLALWARYEEHAAWLHGPAAYDADATEWIYHVDALGALAAVRERAA